jgi:hypothetical protein
MEACVIYNWGVVDFLPIDERLGINSPGLGGVGAAVVLITREQLKDKEWINGRVAMLGTAATLLMEILSEKSLDLQRSG